MPKIIPIKQLKNTAEISELCHSIDEPVFITKNGFGDMVIMSMNTYEQTLARLNMYRELEISERQIEKGEVEDAKEAIASILDKHGL